jgi:acetyl esterase/lipase
MEDYMYNFKNIKAAYPFLLMAFIGTLVLAACPLTTGTDTTPQKITNDQDLYEFFGGINRPRLKLLTFNGQDLEYPPIIEMAHYNYGFFFRYGVRYGEGELDGRVRIEWEIWQDGIKESRFDTEKYGWEKRSDGKIVIHHKTGDYVYEIVTSSETEGENRNPALVGTWRDNKTEGNPTNIIFYSTGKARFNHYHYDGSWNLDYYREGTWRTTNTTDDSGDITISFGTLFPQSSSDTLMEGSYQIQGEILKAVNDTVEFKRAYSVYNNISYGGDEKQKLDLSIPSGNIFSSAAIVYIHGGGYIGGSKNRYPGFIADYRDNFVVASIGYRLMTPPPGNNDIHMDDMLADVGAALTKINETADDYGVTINKVILMGHSAGAHLALLYSYKNFSSSPIPIVSCVSLAGPTDFTDDEAFTAEYMEYHDNFDEMTWVFQNLTGKDEFSITQNNYTQQEDYDSFKSYVEAISPLHYLNIATGDPLPIPPTILIQAENDITVPYPNAVSLNNALDSKGISAQLIVPEGLSNGHNLGNISSNEDEPLNFAGQSWVNTVKTWIENYIN